MSKYSVGKIAEPSDVSKIARIYTLTEMELKKIFRAFTPLDYTASKSISFKEDVSRLVRDLNRSSLAWSNDAVPDAYDDSMKKARLRLDLAGGRTDPLFNPRVHADAIRAGVETTNEFLLRANVSINQNADIFSYLISRAAAGMIQLQAWDMRDEEVISDLLDEAIALGASRWKLSKLVMGHFEELIGEGQFININGRNYNLKKYSRMVARTRLRKIQSDAVIRTCEEYDNDLVQVSDHGTTTPICLPYEGNVYSVTGKSKDYPVLPDTPPFHPNCMHNISPTTPEIIARNPQRRVSQLPEEET